jgi:hypothetical protein
VPVAQGLGFAKHLKSSLGRLEHAAKENADESEKRRSGMVLSQTLENKVSAFIIPAVDQILDLSQTFLGETDVNGSSGFADG